MLKMALNPYFIVDLENGFGFLLPYVLSHRIHFGETNRKLFLKFQLESDSNLFKTEKIDFESNSQILRLNKHTD